MTKSMQCPECATFFFQDFRSKIICPECSYSDFDVNLDDSLKMKNIFEWWNSMPFELKWNKCVKHKEVVIDYPYRNPETLSGKELHQIYIKELVND